VQEIKKSLRTIADLTVVDQNLVKEMLASLTSLLEQGIITPLPSTRFAASRLVDAMQLLQKAKHIGKVVVVMPKYDQDTKEFKDILFNERSTYLITGGKGAIGLATAEWMVKRGAKYIILLGRGPPNEKTLEAMRKLEDLGGKIISMEADVTAWEECRQVFGDIERNPTLPPLRGIHHCAGVLRDRSLGNQTWEDFDYVMSPKVKGAWNIHKLSLNLPLEFFVVHSSMACTFGNFGQSNYTAGNAFMESLVEKRVSMGLPGMCISWGHIVAGLAEKVELRISEPATLSQAMKGMERFFFENRSVICGGFIRPRELNQLIPLYKTTFLKGISESVGSSNDTLVKNGGGDEGKKVNLKEMYANIQGGEEEKRVLIRGFVKDKLCETLGLSHDEVPDDVKFARLGLDSLLSIELYNKLTSQLGDIDLGYVDMEQHGTMDQMTVIIKTALEANI